MAFTFKKRGVGSGGPPNAMKGSRKRKFVESVPANNTNDDTQPVDKSIEELESLSRKPYGRLIAMNNGVSNIDLYNDVFTCGRGGCGFPQIHYTFPNLINDQNLYKYISKKQFSILRDRKEKKTKLVDFSRNGTLINKELVGVNKAVDLMNGDLISIGTAKMIVFVYHDVAMDDYPAGVTRKYVITNHALGKGGYGKVLLGYTRCERREMVAVKILNTSAFVSRTSRAVAKQIDINNEINVMKKIDHPNCVRIFDWINCQGQSFIFLEYLSGGEFFERIVDPKFERQGMGESLGKYFAYQLIDAVAYLHEREITHRDIKPENILCLTTAERTIVKLSDFGMAKMNKTMRTQCGTPSYIAPEVANKDRCQYTPKVDVWSLGCVLFTAFVGYPPFSDDYRDMGMSQQVKTGRLIFHAQWRRITAASKKAICSMLIVDPSERASAVSLLKSAWMCCPEAERAIGDIQIHMSKHRPT